MRKLILAAVAGTAFALAGCTGSEKPSEAAVEATSADASDVAADASSAAAADSSTAAKM